MPFFHSQVLNRLTPTFPSKNHQMLLPVSSGIALMASIFSADHLKWRCCCIIPTRNVFVSSAVDGCLKSTARYSTARYPEGMWEDPDDSSESESEDAEEVNERDLDFESDWEEETQGDSSSAAAASIDRPHDDDDDDDDDAAEYEDILATVLEEICPW